MRQILVLVICLCLGVYLTPAQNRSFINMGFEPPYTPTTTTWNCFSETSLVGWKTSATDNMIEIWTSGYNGISSKEGTQFAELNANQTSRLYQTVYLVNGETLSWDFWHRGRASSTISDVMQLNIYSQTGSSKLVTLQTQSTTNAAWVNYTGSWVCTLPNGLYQFSFEAISTATGDNTVGNFIDGCNIGLRPLIEFTGAAFSGVEWQGNDNVPTLMVNGTVPAGGITVSFTIVGGTATNTTDYTIANLTIPAGAYTTSTPIAIPLSILADVNAESSETVIIALNSVTGTGMFADANGDGTYCSQTTYTIVDNIAPGGVITGLNVWLRADKGVYSNNPGTTAATHGSNVLYWKDNSPQGNHAAIASATYPTYNSLLSLSNYNPSVYFSANNKYFNCNLASVRGSDYNIFTAQTRLSSTEGYVLGTLSTTTNRGLHMGYNSNTSIRINQYNNDLTKAVTAYDNPLASAILFSQLNQSSGHQIAEYRNSTKTSGTNANTTTISGTAQGVIGVGYASNTGLISNTSEIIVYNRVLSASDQQRVLSYLAIRNGITIDQTIATDYVASDGSTTFWNSTTAGSYKKDIALVARDDLSGLQQKQSRSQNSGEILTLGIGEIAISNATNVNSISVDRSALAWANNGGLVNSWGVSDFGVTTNGETMASRIARTWQVQKTGTIGQTRIGIDLSSIAWGIDLQYIRLLVDADGVFASGAQSIAPAIYDNVAKTAEFNVSFANALSYLSLGSVNGAQAPLPITLTQFAASRVDNATVNLHWQTESERNVYEYVIERSFDGLQFDSIALLLASGNSQQPLKYDFVDSNAPATTCYYRLRYVELDGTYKYSKVATVEGLTASGYCRISTLNYGRMVTFQFISDDPSVRVQILSLQGQIIKDSFFQSGITHTLSLPYSGVYFAKIFVADQQCTAYKVVVYE